MTSISVNLGASRRARRAASLSIRNRIEALRHFVGEDPLVSALGLLWLLDGTLQFQPFMFSLSFVNGIMAPTAAGNPGVVAQPITAVSAFLLPDIRF